MAVRESRDQQGAQRPQFVFQTRQRKAVKTAGATIGLARATLVVDSLGAYRGLQEYRKVVGGGIDVVVGRGLPDAKDLEYDQTDKQDRGDYLQMTGLLRNLPQEVALESQLQTLAEADNLARSTKPIKVSRSKA